MDPQLQARIDEARANGYSDEEIQAYLASQNTPTPAEAASAAGQPVSQYQPVDRSEEYKGLGQGVGLKALETGAELYAGKKLILDPLLKRFAPGTTPVAPPTTFTGGANPAWDQALSKPPAPPATQQPGMMDRANQIVRQLALDKVVKSAGVPAAVGMGGMAATGLAGRQMGAMTPEQRKQFYDNPMLGAMGGDAGLAAAIMNRGQ